MQLIRRLVLLTAAALLIAGCGDDGGPRFVTGGGQASCMQHQPEPPGSRYTDSERQRTGEVLEVLRYYTENGRKPYCDGRGPSEIDQQWAQYYVSQGAERANVAPLLAG